MELKEIDMKDIVRNPKQPRQSFDHEKIIELSNSIKEGDLLQPITVRPMKRLEKQYKEEREIKCPFCGFVQWNDDNQYPVTYWGEPEVTEMDCIECNKKFYVKENVSRTYETSAKEDGF